LNRNMSRDRHGAVLGLPFMLLISCIIIAMAVPLALDRAADTFRSESEDTARGEIDRLHGAALTLWTSEPGSAVRVDIEVPGGRWGVDGMSLGDYPGGVFQSTAKISVGGREELVVLEPQVPLTSEYGDTLELGPGAHGLMLTHWARDTNGDGKLEPGREVYIRVSTI